MGINATQSLSFAALKNIAQKDKQGLVKTNTLTIPVKSAVNNHNLPRVTAEQAIVYFTSTKKVSLPALVSEINPANLKKHVEYLASDELAGRKPGTEGIKKAQEYIVQNFKDAGLKPFTPLADSDFVNKVVYEIMYQECERQITPKSVEYIMNESDDALKIGRGKIPLNNILGYVPAKKESDEYIFLMAHYDHLGRDHYTGKVYTGADDNASGVAALMEVARVLAKTKPEKNIVFLATSGEEMGTLGASLLAKQMTMKGFKDKVDIVNLDCLAAEGDFMTI
ncbi:MAG: M20/M25/M40 family metallo-hydrolase, partial [Cyanobacteriota bacterium]